MENRMFTVNKVCMWGFKVHLQVYGTYMETAMVVRRRMIFKIFWGLV